MQPRHASAGQPIESGCASVLLPLPLPGPYDYRVPPDLALTVGGFVAVPLGARDVIGVVWGEGEGGVAREKLKDVTNLLDVPPLPEGLRNTIDWTASYTLSPPGAVLRMAMSAPDALRPPKPVIAYVAAEGEPAKSESAGGIRMTPARRRVFEVLAEGVPRTLTDLAREAGVGAGVVRTLAGLGMLRALELMPGPRFREPDWRRPGPDLSPSQAAAVRALQESLAGEFGVTLLDGVTGSGKTEVYFEAIAGALAAGRQALVLVPEIALTAQWLQRFERRFGAAPAEWHSDLTQVRRRHTWRAVSRGEARIVIGARSALFLPYPDLGLIVVDEEHDTSFKQEDGVIYNARDMAVVRARMGDFPVVLVSATPSLESTENCWSGRYRRLHLPDRHGGARLPDIRVVDMRDERLAPQSWVSPTFRDGLESALASGEQAMLFLNRRGYAPLTLCRGCGLRLECPQCTAWLVEHRLAGRLQCHHCGHTASPPRDCPKCGAADSFAACGPGVERLAEEVAEAIPRARIAIMASDTVHGPAAAAELVRRMQAREIDVLIGTQIMAKGHHFPLLTFVGVIDADLGLAGGDLRAAERTFQLLHQVAGRAGREARHGLVCLQTYAPDHPVIRALVSGERDAFMAAEAEERRRHHMPPYGRLAAVIVSGRDEQAVDAASRALGRTAPRGDGVAVFGPAPAPLAVLRGRHRRRLLLKARKEISIQTVLRRWLRQVRTRAGVRIQVDIDPYSFM